MTVRLRATIVVEYDADPVHYKTNNVEEMINIDIEHMDIQFLVESEDLKITIEEVKT